MRLGLGSYTYAWAIGVAGHPPSQPLDALGLIARAAALDVRVVQLADNLPLDGLSDAERELLRAEAMRAGIAVEVGTRGIAPDHLRHYLGIARQFGSPILRAVVDTAAHHPSPDEIVATLRALMPEFEAANVTLAVENHDRFRTRDLAAILNAVGSPRIGICLDTVNSLGAGEGPEMVVDQLARYVVNLHIKDFRVRRVSHNMGFVVEGTPAGQGQLDLPWLLRRLADRPPMSAILELWPPPQESTEETIQLEDQWARESIPYLRGLISE